MTSITRYFGVFWILCSQFVKHNPLKNIVLMIFGSLAGLFQPLPITMLALAGSMQLSEMKYREVSIFDTTFQFMPMELVISAIILAAFIYTLRYVVSMSLFTETERWQVTLMNKFVNLPSEFQRLDLENIKPDTNYRVYYSWAMRTLSGSVQIGLLFVYGLPNLILILSLAVIIGVLNFWIMLLLLLSLIILSPIYAIIMRKIYSTRKVVIEGISAKTANLKSYIENRPKFKLADYKPVEVSDLLGVTAVLKQHRGLILLQVVLTFHILLILLGFVLLYARGVIGVNFRSILLFLVVFMFIRSTGGLIQFFGHVNRNYPSIATLADTIKLRKKLKRTGNAPITLSVKSVQVSLNMGDIIYGDFRIPTDPIEFQLLSKCFKLGESAGTRTYIVNFSDAIDPDIEYDNEGSPIVICCSDSEYKTLTPEIQNRFVWVIFGTLPSNEAIIQLSKEGKSFTASLVD